jgi:MFS family permease
LTAPGPAQEWRRGWPPVAAGVAGLMLSTVHNYSFGVLIIPLENTFGWTRAEISSGPLIVSFVGAVMGPVIGVAIDRWGARPIGVAGAVFYCVALALLATITGNLWSWWLTWGLVALAMPFITTTTWATVVSRRFDRSRGLALAVTLCGSGLGAAIIPAITHAFLERFGWRGTYLIQAGFWAVIAIPVITILFRDADRTPHMPAHTGETQPPPSSRSGPAGFTSPAFLIIAAAASVLTLGVSAFIVNMVPILVSQGITSRVGVMIAGLIGVGVIVGRLCGGYLLDRLNAKRVAAATVCAPAFSAALLLLVPSSVPVASVAVLLMGLSLGAEYDSVAYLASRHFGLKNFGMLFGTIAGLLVLTNGLGPMIANHAYDTTHSYRLVLWAMIPASLLSSILFLSLGPEPRGRSGGASGALMAPSAGAIGTVRS